MQLLNIVDKDLTELNFTAATSSEVVNAKGCQTLSFATQVTEDVAVSGCTVKIEKALEDSGPWFEDTAATNITETANFFLEASQPIDANFYRLTFAIAAGELTVAIHATGKGMV